jgi:hypothetical protein
MQNFTHQSGGADLCPSIWSRVFGLVMDLMCIRFYADHRKSGTQTLVMIRQAFGRELCMGFQTGKPKHETKIGRTDKEQSQEYAHCFL